MSSGSREKRRASRHKASADGEPDNGEELAAVGLLDMSSGWPQCTREKRARSPEADSGDETPVQKATTAPDGPRDKKKSVSSTVAKHESYEQMPQPSATDIAVPKPMLHPALQLNQPGGPAPLGARPYAIQALPYHFAGQHFIHLPAGPRPPLPQLWMPLPPPGTMPFSAGHLMGSPAVPQPGGPHVFPSAGGFLANPHLVPYPPLHLWSQSFSHLQQPRVVISHVNKGATPSINTRTVNKCRKCGQPYMNPYHARDRTNKWICSIAKSSTAKGEE